MIELAAEPLRAGSFAPFGEVIEAAGAHEAINAGTSRKFADLAAIDVGAQGGRPAVHLYHAEARAADEPVRLMERHPLGSQLFMPLDGARYLVVVGPAGAPPEAATLRAFLAEGVGINLKRGVWHCPLHVLDRSGRFLVVDREGPGDNLDMVDMTIRVSGAGAP